MHWSYSSSGGGSSSVHRHARSSCTSNSSSSSNMVPFAFSTVLLLCSCSLVNATLYTPFGAAAPHGVTHATIITQQAAQQYRYQCSTGDYAGVDIEWAYDQSKASCEGKCNEKAECTFYVISADKTCYLKSRFAEGPNGANNPDAACTSCIKLAQGASSPPTPLRATFSTCQVNVDAAGTNLLQTGSFKVSNELFCMAACQQRLDCSFYVYSSHQQCTLRRDLWLGKDGSHGTIAAAGVDVKSCPKKMFEVPICPAGQGLQSGVCKPCHPFFEYSLGGRDARCETCGVGQRPEPGQGLGAPLRCTSGPAPSCNAGQGIAGGICMPCTNNTVSPGGVGVVCTTCTTGEIPNDDSTACIAGVSAAASEYAGYFCVPDWDYAGTDRRQMDVETIADCAVECTSDAGCQFFAVITSTSPMLCYLKGDLLTGPHGNTGSNTEVHACIKEAAMHAAFCPAGWTFATHSLTCCDGLLGSHANCPPAAFQCSVATNVFPIAWTAPYAWPRTIVPCAAVQAACPPKSAPYGFTSSGGLCCKDATRLQLTDGVATGCNGRVLAVRSNTKAGASVRKYTPAANCAGGWVPYGPLARRFCCLGTVQGNRCSGASCAADGNLNNGGAPFCSSVTAMRLIIWNLQWCDTGFAQPDRSKLYAMFFEEKHSIQQFYTAGSFGHAFLDKNDVAIANAHLPCGNFSLETCDMWQVYDYLKANAAKYGVESYDRYTYKVLLPPASAACNTSFTGVAGYAAGDMMAVAPGATLTDKSLFKHELGHLIGLPHSGLLIRKDNIYDAYGDLSTPMGILGEGCLYSGPEMVKLGWAAPSTGPGGLAAVSWSSIQAGAVTKFQLKALADDPSQAIVLVLLPPSDLLSSATQWQSNLGSMLYITYRVAKNLDSGLPHQFDFASSLHTHHIYTDDSVNDHELIAWLITGVGFVSHPLKLVIVQLSGTATSAEVLLCKYTSVPSDCAGQFVDFATQESAAAAAAAVSRIRTSGLGHDRLAS